MTFLNKYTNPQSIVNLILLDHHLLKEAMDALIDEGRDPKERILSARVFLGVLRLHSIAEERTVYPDLECEPEFHFIVLEAEVEHQLIDERLKSLIPRIPHLRTLNEEIHSELKLLVELVRSHLENEEKTLLRLMERSLDEHRLKTLAIRFSRVRRFTPEELKSIPQNRAAQFSWKRKITHYLNHWRG